MFSYYLLYMSLINRRKVLTVNLHKQLYVYYVQTIFFYFYVHRCSFLAKD